MKRRTFVKNLGASGFLLAASPALPYFRPSKKLDLLVLGGTDFLGPAIVKSALEQGHKTTLFNRRITNPELFTDLPFIKGDREMGAKAYDPLKSKTWDVIIDVWPQHSKLVDEATEALQAHTNHYMFISSIATYKDFNDIHRTEAYDTVPLPNDKTKWEYPEEKAAAENFVTERFQNKHTILRPGAIKGWRDPAYDLLYWLIKLERGESILAPGDGTDPLQFIDVNDVGRFAIRACENETFGIYNCVGPKKEGLSWKTFLETAKRHLNSSSKIHWSSQDFLKDHEVSAWNDLPLWAPISDDHFMQVSNSKSLSAGFTYTPLEKTIDDCLAWHHKHGNDEIVFGKGEEPVGLERSKELNVINALPKG